MSGDTPIPADHAAVDLEVIEAKCRPATGPWCDILTIEDGKALIAEVKALRARVTDLEDDYLRRHNDAVDNFEKWKVAKAHATALAVALKFYASRSNHDAKVLQSGFGRSNVSKDDGAKARAALTATPADGRMSDSADPAAIDRILDAARQGVYCSDDLRPLITAVEALRERVEAARLEVQQCHAAATCCCGSYMKEHTLGDGHTPVSMYDHALDQTKQENETLQAYVAWAAKKVEDLNKKEKKDAP